MASVVVVVGVTSMTDLLEIPSDFCADDVYRLPIIGKGCTRHVYALSADLVVKVEPTEFKGQNKDEVTNWLKATERGLDRYLATMEGWATDYSWLVMERCTTLRTLPTIAPAFPANIADELEGCGISDTNPFNYGVNRLGDLVLIDYAM